MMLSKYAMTNISTENGIGVYPAVLIFLDMGFFRIWAQVGTSPLKQLLPAWLQRVKLKFWWLYYIIYDGMMGYNSKVLPDS